MYRVEMEGTRATEKADDETDEGGERGMTIGEAGGGAASVSLS